MSPIWSTIAFLSKMVMTTLRSTVVFVSAVALLLLQSCTDLPTAPAGCSNEIDGLCWSFLGLESEWVTAVAVTPWGLYAGSQEHGVFHLDEQTGEWENLGLNHAIVTSILYVPTETPRLLVGVAPYSDETTQAAVFASEDEGDTWISWDGGLASRQGYRTWAYSLAVDPCNPKRIFLGQSYSVLRSDDGGESWNYVLGSEDGWGGGANAITISPDCDGRLWVGGQAGFYAALVHRSSDWGTSWEHWVQGGRDDAVRALKVDPNEPDRLWAGMGGRVRHTRDGGETWQTVLTTEHPSYVRGLALIGNVLFAAADEEIRKASDSGLTFPLGLYRSRNRGLRWDTLQVPERARGAWSMDVDKTGNLLIGTRSGVWSVEPK